MGNTTSTTTESSATPAAHVFQVPAEPKKKKLPDRIVPLAYSSIVDLDRLELKELDDKYEALMRAALANQNMVRRRARDEDQALRKIRSQLNSLEEADVSPMEMALSFMQAPTHSPHASGMSTPACPQQVPFGGPTMARSPSVEVFRGPHPGPQVTMIPPAPPAPQAPMPLAPSIQGVELVEALRAVVDGNRKRDRSPSPPRISSRDDDRRDRRSRARDEDRDRRSRRRSSSPSSKRHRSDSPRRSRREQAPPQQQEQAPKPAKRICEAIVDGTTNRCRRTALHDCHYCALHKQTLEDRLHNLNAPVNPPSSGGDAS